MPISPDEYVGERKKRKFDLGDFVVRVLYYV